MDDLDTSGGPAFPAHENWRIDSGMTLRDYFAAKVLNAHAMYFENAHSMGNAEHRQLLARDCYAMADAMIAERAK